MAIRAINTINATIQVRTGLEQELDTDQLTAGEWAVSKDMRYVRMCFAPGIVLRMATYEVFEQDMVEIQTILATCQDIQTAVDAMAVLAEQHKDDAKEYAAKSEQYSAQAKNEADRAKAEADRAAAIAGYDIDSALSETSANPVQNKVVAASLNDKLDKTGDVSNAVVTFEQAAERANIESGEKTGSIFSKIRKWFSDLKPHAFASPVDNLLATVKGMALDASVGPAIDKRITANANAISQLNSELVKSIEVYMVLNELTWKTSQDGKYYSPLKLNIPSDSTLLGCCISRWGGLRDGDNLFGYLTSNSNEPGIASNINSFTASAFVNLVFLYK